MQQKGTQAISVTISGLLGNCGGLSLLQKCKDILVVIEDVFVATAFIDMQCKSGNLEAAYEVFKRNANRITHGLGRGPSIQPDAILLTSVLSSRKNSGLVDEGWKYSDSISSDLIV
ncbi:hypothetical protein PTKIN_Ptkin15bG0053500 [Pterospermum kingtungense]